MARQADPSWLRPAVDHQLDVDSARDSLSSRGPLSRAVLNNLPGGVNKVLCPLVTALPGYPYDGQEVLLSWKGAGGTGSESIIHLRYNGGAIASAYAWQVVGSAIVTSQNTAGGGPYTATTYTAITAGPTIAVPTGMSTECRVRISGNMNNSAAAVGYAVLSYTIPGVAAGTSDYVGACKILQASNGTLAETAVSPPAYFQIASGLTITPACRLVTAAGQIAFAGDMVLELWPVSFG